MKKFLFLIGMGVFLANPIYARANDVILQDLKSKQLCLLKHTAQSGKKIELECDNKVIFSSEDNPEAYDQEIRTILEQKGFVKSDIFLGSNENGFRIVSYVNKNSTPIFSPEEKGFMVLTFANLLTAMAREPISEVKYVLSLDTVTVGVIPILTAGVDGFLIGKLIVYEDEVHFHGKLVDAVSRHVIEPTFETAIKLRATLMAQHLQTTNGQRP